MTSQSAACNCLSFITLPHEYYHYSASLPLFRGSSIIIHFWVTCALATIENAHTTAELCTSLSCNEAHSLFPHASVGTMNIFIIYILGLSVWLYSIVDHWTLFKTGFLHPSILIIFSFPQISDQIWFDSKLSFSWFYTICPVVLKWLL